MRSFVAANAMPCASVAAMLLTCLLVPPDAGYGSYVDWTTLGKLACMLAVVASLREAGVFQAMASRLVAHCRSVRALVLVLVAVTGAASMLITNDMALLALLPLSAAALVAAGRADLTAAVFVLQGLAANLWGMVLPFGNPQNIFLVGVYGVGFSEFVQAMAQPFAVSVAVVLALCLAVGRRGRAEVPADPARVNPVRAAVLAGLFALSVAAVLGACPVWLALVAAAAALTALDARAPRGSRPWPLRVDWGLIVTFAAFFVFSGNLSRIPVVSSAFVAWTAGGAFVPGALLSQVVSNVPAAILLAQFTGDWRGLLVGVNVGGAGTPVGSLATLIVATQYLALSREAAAGFPSRGRFWALLLGANLAVLAVLLGCGMLLGW